MRAVPDTARADLEAAILGLEPGQDRSFAEIDAEVRRFQATHNPVVRAYGEAGRYLPIGAFRLAHVGTFPAETAEVVFRSSGTSGSARAVHPVRSVSWYHRVVREGYSRAFDCDTRVILGYVPRYAPDSSLVHMLRHLVERVGGDASDVFSGDPARFAAVVEAARRSGVPLFIMGAAFGLLDLIDHTTIRLPENARVIETGGMKTHRRAITRSELHGRLANGFGIRTERIGSEYGMCELMSQSWAPSGAWYEPPPWMRVHVVDPDDPDRPMAEGSVGVLAVTDLANLYTASHLLTEDLAMQREGRFTIVGRVSGASLRGCNFLMESTP